MHTVVKCGILKESHLHSIISRIQRFPRTNQIFNLPPEGARDSRIVLLLLEIKVRYTSFVKEISILTCDGHYRVSQESSNVETADNKRRRVGEIDMASTSFCSGLVAQSLEKWRNNSFIGDIFNKGAFLQTAKKERKFIHTHIYIFFSPLERSLYERLMVFIFKIY